jgi:hypothetical protein
MFNVTKVKMALGVAMDEGASSNHFSVKHCFGGQLAPEYSALPI